MQTRGSKPSTPLPLNVVLTIVSDKTRWKIFTELIKGKPLPVAEIARRTGVAQSNISKHMVAMRNAGIVQQGFGRLYELPERFIVPGERSLDFGYVVLRLDTPV